MKYSLFSFLLLLNWSAQSQILEKQGLKFKDASYNVIIFKLDSFVYRGFRIIDSQNGESAFDLANNHSQGAPFFMMAAAPVDQYCNLLGLFIKDHRKLQPLNTRSGTGNFFLTPNGFIGFTSFGVSVLKAELYDEKIDWRHALQSGPMLVVDKKINSILNPSSVNMSIRSGAGIYQKNNGMYLVFAIALQPVTFFDFASLFSEKFKCHTALSLEGGQAALMHLPSDNPSNMSYVNSCKYLFYSIP